jgi:predicted Zn-dependent protease with MMP-like domain
MFQVDREAFVGIVLDALQHLPQEFRDRIANHDFAVDDVANPSDYARTRVRPGSTLLGVYRGVPLTRRGAHYNMTLPDSIVIFQQPIERLASDEDDLRRRIAHVVRHEVAHYFGISDDRLHEIGAY